MALVTYHGPRPEITASFRMPKGDVITFTNGRPSETKEPGPHSYVLPRDHPVPVGILFAVGLAVLVRQRHGLWLTVRLGPGDWDFACHNIYGLRRVTPRMLATPRRRRLLRRMLRRRDGREYALVERTTRFRWYAPQAPVAWDLEVSAVEARGRYRRTWHAVEQLDEDRWPAHAVQGLGWDVTPLRASSTRNLSVNEDLNWRPRGSRPFASSVAGACQRWRMSSRRRWLMRAR